MTDQALQCATEHLRAGHFEKAEQAFSNILQQTPDHVEALHLLGIIYHQTGRDEQAELHIARALELKPDFTKAAFNLGVVRQALSRFAEATIAYDIVLNQQPDHVNALINMGNAYKTMDDLNKAAETYQIALKLHPDSALAHNNLGNIFNETARHAEAEVCYRQAIKLKPDYADALLNLCDILSTQGQVEEAETYCRHALKLRPLHAKSHNALGNILRDAGHMDNAIACYRKAIECDPNYGGAYRNLAGISKLAKDDRAVIAMEALFRGTSSSPEQRMQTGFALAKARSDQKRYSEEFDCLLEANRLKRQTLSYASIETAARFKAVRETFHPTLLGRLAEAGCGDNMPIFILGMPRSGTTLVEQILASHPDVSSASEVHYVRNIIQTACRDKNKKFPEGLPELNSNVLQKLAGNYLQRLQKHGPNAHFITDKMPGNFFYIGIIALMLPRARIIALQRNPMDICFSLFSKYFRESHPYAYDLEELGRYYLEYAALMEYWNTVLPGRILTISYEALTEHPEREIRQLLDFCNLSFNPDCLNFHRTQRVVTTASANQVRQPLYKSSVERWRRYEEQLEPLRKILEPLL